MADKLSIDVKKIFRKYEKSVERTNGIEILSDIRGLKYILKGDSLVLASIWDGLFAVDLRQLPELARELMEISKTYDLSDCGS